MPLQYEELLFIIFKVFSEPLFFGYEEIQTLLFLLIIELIWCFRVVFLFLCFSP